MPTQIPALCSPPQPGPKEPGHCHPISALTLPWLLIVSPMSFSAAKPNGYFQILTVPVGDSPALSFPGSSSSSTVLMPPEHTHLLPAQDFSSYRCPVYPTARLRRPTWMASRNPTHPTGHVASSCGFLPDPCLRGSHAAHPAPRRLWQALTLASAVWATSRIFFTQSCSSSCESAATSRDHCATEVILMEKTNGRLFLPSGRMAGGAREEFGQTFLGAFTEFSHHLSTSQHLERSSTILPGLFALPEWGDQGLNPICLI